MALGVPTVATAIGTIFRIIKDGENGFLVNSDDQWKEKLKALAFNNDLRRKLGERGVQTVEEFYSINANKKKYLDILESQ